MQYFRRLVKRPLCTAQGDEDAFFVADLGDIVKKHLRWTTALPRVHPFYAVKCNPMEAVVQTLARLGAGFDCASEVELELVRGMGVLPERIIYANPCKQTSHIKKAASLGICAMTFDNEEELIKVARAHPNAKMVLRIATEDSGSMFPMSIKFGASLEECGHLLKVARELGVEIIGVSFHVGSNSSDPHCFSESIANARGVFDLGADLGHEMALLDIGGGFPGTDDFIVTFEEFAKVINQSLELHFPAESGVRIIAEPGRYYVASAFTLAANIIGKKFLPCNKETFNDEECAKSVKYYINDGRFGSFEMICHSHFTEMAVPYKQQSAGQPLYSSSIWGPTCAAEDVILRQTQLPELQVGDWLIFENMGAYTVSLGTHFNGFSVPRVHFCISSKIW
ncbi:DCOR1 decarboxylase, partial [Polyodon spathula]|nr:DCOR1 decarboxylase [Polyodon spathula]